MPLMIQGNCRARLSRMVKRFMDIVGALIGLLIFAPLYPIVWCAIRLESPGGAIHRSRRWGRNGASIDVLKLRTMIDGAERALHADAGLQAQFFRDVKFRNDPRVTGLGRWLRTWSIDEIPQFYNVLVGEMSLVGPRPKLPGEERKYTTAWDFVLSVRPGLTGLWQVSGRNDTSYADRVRLDVWYVQNWSLLLDLKILLLTVPAVIRGTGAR